MFGARRYRTIFQGRVRPTPFEMLGCVVRKTHRAIEANKRFNKPAKLGNSLYAEIYQLNRTLHHHNCYQ